MHVPASAPAASPPSPPELGLLTLALLADGLSNAEICESTGMSITTVKAQVRRAHAASGLVRRPELAAWARERGFVAPDESGAPPVRPDLTSLRQAPTAGRGPGPDRHTPDAPPVTGVPLDR